MFVCLTKISTWHLIDFLVLFSQKTGVRVNNLSHQHSDMYIAATVSFVRTYAKLTKNAKYSEKSVCAPNVSILVVSYTETKTVDTSSNVLKL